MTVGTAPKLKVMEVHLYERDVRLRIPFRFGIVTLIEAPQAFVRVRVRTEDGREAWGTTAELMVPKWFDKDPELSNEDNFDQLRTALRLAADMYQVSGPRTAFGQFAESYEAHLAAAAEIGLKPLVASFGTALMDKSVLDALCRLSGVSVFAAIRANLPGIEPAGLASDLSEFDMARFLAALEPRSSIQARHTVGLVDPIATPDESVDDGLPVTLEEVVRTYGHRYFKVKVGGDIGADIARLEAIAAVLDTTLLDYSVTLDGNEQYDDVAAVTALWHAIAAEPALQRFVDSILFVEQPIARAVALERDVLALAARRPVIIDESDGEIGSFPAARKLGYTGVSSKSCKCLYKALINAARCAQWNTGKGETAFFISGEDLTCQAGLAVQQDLALVSLLGLTHVERNGHHYVRGMAGAPEAEQRAFLATHGDLYRDVEGQACLRIEDGRIALTSLDCTGFATACLPDFHAMRDMQTTGKRYG